MLSPSGSATALASLASKTSAVLKAEVLSLASISNNLIHVFMSPDIILSGKPLTKCQSTHVTCALQYSYHLSHIILGNKSVHHHSEAHNHHTCTVMILSFRTDRSGQTVQAQIRLLLKEQSDQGLHWLLFHRHLFDKKP